MLDFIVVGLPRSGTTWAANWLTTDKTYCLHDPLNKVHYLEWSSPSAPYFNPDPSIKRGVSCTGIWRWVDWLNAQDVPTLIIDRPFRDVQESLASIGSPPLCDSDRVAFSKIEGMRVPFKDLFNVERAEAMWSHLIGTPCDLIRFKQLTEMAIEPEFRAVEINPRLQVKLHSELYKK